MDCDEPSAPKNLSKVSNGSINAMKRILKNDFFYADDVSTVEVKLKTTKQMAMVNDLNWQYRVHQANGRLTPINDFESMIIGDYFTKVKKNAKTSTKLLSLPTLSMQVNLYTSVMMKDGKVKLVSRAPNNNRYDRARPETTDKGNSANLIINMIAGHIYGQSKKAAG